MGLAGAPLTLSKQWESMNVRRLSPEERERVAKHLAQEAVLASQLASKALEAPEELKLPSSQRIVKGASLQFLAVFPEIVRAKYVAFERGDYRLAKSGTLSLGPIVCDEEPRFALVWGQYLAPARDGYGCVVFRLSEADYRDAFGIMQSLKEERQSSEYREATKDALNELNQAPRSNRSKR